MRIDIIGPRGGLVWYGLVISIACFKIAKIQNIYQHLSKIFNCMLYRTLSWCVLEVIDVEGARASHNILCKALWVTIMLIALSTKSVQLSNGRVFPIKSQYWPYIPCHTRPYRTSCPSRSKRWMTVSVLSTTIHELSLRRLNSPSAIVLIGTSSTWVAYSRA